MFIKRERKKIHQQTSVSCWEGLMDLKKKKKRLYRLSRQGGAIRWVHDAKLVRLTAALPLSPLNSNLYLQSLQMPHQRRPQDHTLPSASVYRREVSALCVCFHVRVCMRSAIFTFPFREQPYIETSSLWKPAVWQARHRRQRNCHDTQILLDPKLIQDGSPDSWLTIKMWAHFC